MDDGRIGAGRGAGEGAGRGAGGVAGRGAGERPLPRLDMLRDLTDRTVLDLVIRHGRVTRAELAAATTISKPTISDAVRRLETAGLLMATGARTGHRGRVATFYELSREAGWVLALEINQSGLALRAAGLSGDVFLEDSYPPVSPGDTAGVAAQIRDAIAASREQWGHGKLSAIVLSVANPVDPRSGDIIALPESPFPEGLIDADEVFGAALDVPVIIQNDVNLAALAERTSGAAVGVSSFAYVYVGAALGMGLYIGDRLVPGAHGLAGEIGYLTGEAGSLADAYRRGSGARAGAASAEVDAVLAAMASGGADEIGRLVASAIGATCAVVDPELVVLGGPVGRSPLLIDPTIAALQQIWPMQIRVVTTAVEGSAPLMGALERALMHGREQMLPS